jgi:hypothetical protein
VLSVDETSYSYLLVCKPQEDVYVSILEKLIVDQIINKFPSFYGTQRVITVFVWFLGSDQWFGRSDGSFLSTEAGNLLSEL